MYSAIEQLVEDIQKELAEAKRYNYSDWIVKQDLIRLIREFERDVSDRAYEEAKDDLESSEKNYGY